MKPYFSIILPCYDRAGFIARALDSCLRQDFADFEIIVVDDASSDGSSDIVRSYREPRIRLLTHAVNRGACPSRNTGMAAAAGQWFVFLDSDDELLAGALTTIHQRTCSLDEGVTGLRFMCQDDRGGTSPVPPLQNQLWDYQGYITWLNATRGSRSETLPCTRAATFPAIHYPDDHANEGLYHLDIARAGSVLACSDLVRLYHDDANDRLCAPNARRTMQHAREAAQNAALILQRHGEALRRWGPGLYHDTLRACALFAFLSGDRRNGLGYATRFLRELPRSPRMYAILAAGLLDRHVLAWAQETKTRLVNG